ncbi:contactin-3-like [Callospermophilus lateralis]|uniref:contactin-3-like n=1 Tax=Callospermophilus lateralis TaxID=76772 RepID=UPI00405412D4
MKNNLVEAQINWRRSDGMPFPSKIKLRKFNGVFEIPTFQQEDAGFYECIAENSQRKNVARGRLTYYAKPHLVQLIKDVEMAVEESLYWECRASGKPKPSYRWLKNGDVLVLEERIQIENSALTISNLYVTDSVMFQCIAENKHGLVYSSAELKVVASAPDFSKNPMKRLVQAQVCSLVSLDCKPRASPRALSFWKKGDTVVQEQERFSFLKDGGLKIHNVTKADSGTYTCTAENQFGKANGTTHLVVTEPTRITLAPSNMDVSVGESVILPCQAQHDPLLDIMFTWYFKEALTDFKKDGSHFEKVGGVRYCVSGEEQESSSKVRVAGNETSARLRGLKSNLAYYAAVRAYNSAGTGPFSATVNATTKKTPPSQPPGNVVWNATDTKVLLNLEQVKAMENESEVTGYKVFYRTSSQNSVQVLNTNKTSAELVLPFQEDYIIEVKATTDGGDGTSSEQIRIPIITNMDARGSTSAISNVHPVSSYIPMVLFFLVNALW